MVTTNIRNILLLGTALAVTACTAKHDLQGRDPAEYYAAHPTKHKVETRSQSHDVFFPSGQARLMGTEIDALMAGLSDVSPSAVESVQIQLHPSQMHNEARKQHLIKILRSRGYAKKDILFEPMPSLDVNGARIDVSYAAYVMPHCPDWRTSPVTNYSNMMNPSNFNCAHRVNLGLQVADPRDLEYGAGDDTPNAQRAAKVVQDYRESSGVSATTTAGTTGGTATSSQ